MLEQGAYDQPAVNVLLAQSLQGLLSVALHARTRALVVELKV